MKNIEWLRQKKRDLERQAKSEPAPGHAWASGRHIHMSGGEYGGKGADGRGAEGAVQSTLRGALCSCPEFFSSFTRAEHSTGDRNRSQTPLCRHRGKAGSVDTALA